ncbi:MAG TPA: bifunctional demethylmenaquinone methyltransferase/2-methoxy-6-polyprenyl-1,4-benzoquinol methylase UbiE [Chromatiaceae bacterium]|nr:bifunctional demethylmenaquinone methyltransferase/2-methoxy-6-polyprenyl-1,4-benzoquinol methylase UbiE [Chromatiaceae bacterium]
MSDSNTTHFGYREVAASEKNRLVRGVFDSVASRYDLMNDLMSGGIHRLWKRHFIATSGIRSGSRVLDLAGGTGDIARLLHRRVGEQGHVLLSDINASMLTIGRQRMEDNGIVRGMDYLLVNAEAIPLPDRSVDAITIAFGLRNVTDKPQALSEMHRVLRPGGRVLILEFSQVRSALLSQLYDAYSFKILPRLGQLVADDADSYRYLAESIRRHPDQESLAQTMCDAGFETCEWFNLALGVVAVHRGFRL